MGSLLFWGFSRLDELWLLKYDYLISPNRLMLPVWKKMNRNELIFSKKQNVIV